MSNRTCDIFKTETAESFHEMLYNSAEKFGDCPAFTFETENGDKTITFKEFKKDVLHVGNWLREQGISKEKIALLSENSYDIIVVYFAVWLSGNIIVPLDKELKPADFAAQLNDCGSRCMIYSQAYEHIPEILRGNHSLDLKSYPSGELRNKSVGEIQDLCVGDPEELAAIIYTSGTTGKSKGVMLSQKNICVATVASCRSTYTEGRSLLFLPISHIFAMVSGLMRSLLNGQEILICRGIATVGDDIRKYNPSFFMAVPALVILLYNKIKSYFIQQNKHEELQERIAESKKLMAQGIDKRREIFADVHAILGGNLKCIIAGGAYMNPVYIEALYDFGIPVTVGYGLTESTSGITCMPIDDIRYDSIGLPLPGVDLKINNLDADGKGDLMVRGNMVMMGYYGDEKATRKVLSPDGWFNTGDVCSIDGEGFVKFYGRSKNVIVLSNGKNVSPEELESAFTGKHGVAEVVVYGKNETIIAEIFPDAPWLTQNGIEYPDEYFEEMRQNANRGQPYFKQISRIRLRGIPFDKTTSGKVKRTEFLIENKSINKEGEEKMSTTQSGRKYVAPETDLEKQICQIFQDLLELDEPYGMTDLIWDRKEDADSLTATEIAVEIMSVKGVTKKLSVSDLAEYITVRSLIYDFLLAESSEEEKLPNANLIIARDSGKMIKPPEKILVTGASGYLGIHIFHELFKAGREVFGLVRGVQKFKDNWAYFFPGESADNANLFEGDVTKEKLGLSDGDYTKLTGEIDAVIHTAANVSHGAAYSVLEPVNVGGTRNVIDFCRAANAVLHHTSSFAVSGFYDEKNALPVLDERRLNVGQNLRGNAYTRSKYRAEEHALRARESGMKVNIYRMGEIIWRNDGVFQLNDNKNGFLARLRAMKKIGGYSERWEDYPMYCAPVDECAKAFVTIVNAGQVNRIWHLFHDHLGKLGDCIHFLIPEARKMTEDEVAQARAELPNDSDIATMGIYLQYTEHSHDLLSCELSESRLKSMGFEWSPVNIGEDVKKKLFG